MDLNIKDVAELLKVSEATVQELVVEGKIPAYRLHDQYRFSRIEVESWVMGNHAVTPNQGMEEHETPGKLQFSLYRALHKGDVLPSVPGSDKEGLIKNVSHLIAGTLNLDQEVLADLLMDREKLQSTGIGNGIALPHTRECPIDARQDSLFVVFPEHPLEYEALDQRPVHTLFFLFAGSDKKHLHILAKIAHLAHSHKLDEVIKERPDKATLLKKIKEWESSL